MSSRPKRWVHQRVVTGAGITLIAIGVGVGVPAALVLTRVVKSQLYGLEAHDPWTLGLATGLLAMVACAAGYVPALRASRVDPMTALRYE